MCVLHLLQKAAALILLLHLFLLPCIARSLSIPRIQVQDKSLSSPVSRSKEHSGSPYVPELIEYSPEGNVLKFKLSCVDCTEDEQQRLADEVISIELSTHDDLSCSPTSPVGLNINGLQLNGRSTQPRLYPAFQGSLANPSIKHSILDHVRWFNFCSCATATSDEECDNDSESIFILEVLGMRGPTPGFTLSHRRKAGLSLLRISDFPDTGAMAAFGRSLHWKAPLMQLQIGAMPTSTLFSTFSSVFPSLTASASDPQLTFTAGHVLYASNAPSPTITSLQTASPTAARESELPSPSAPSAPLHLHVPGLASWQRPIAAADAISTFEHGLATLRSKAQDAAQSLVASLHKMHHCSKDDVPQNIRKPAVAPFFLSPTPSNTARATIPTPSSTVELLELTDAASPSPSAHVISRQAVKAFQITALLIIVVVLLTAVFVLIRRNPRLRAEMAARKEERRNKRLYRRAVCRYRWETALERFKNFRPFRPSRDLEKPRSEMSPSNTYTNGIDWTEWQEKQVSIDSNSTFTSGPSISQGLSELRRAHRLVDGMVSAEEGRSARRIANAYGHSRRWSGSQSSQKTAPPPYEEVGEEVFVVDGMRYVRQEPDTTPDSSVFDTSPRSSVVDSDSESEKD